MVQLGIRAADRLRNKSAPRGSGTSAPFDSGPGLHRDDVQEHRRRSFHSGFWRREHRAFRHRLEESGSGSVTPLDGIRVLDFSHALAGPYCTLLLAEYGAEVYKLEARSGDMGRGWGPPFAGGESNFFLGLNRGKLGVSIDLKHPEGLELCLRLIDKLDVLIENFRPDTMA